MADKRLAFARRKADEALKFFEQRAWDDGMPRARAALDLLSLVTQVDNSVVAPLCRGVCEALAAQGLFCEALEFFSSRKAMIANDGVKQDLLDTWRQTTNSPLPGDLVQLSEAAAGRAAAAFHADSSASGEQRPQHVGTVVAPVACSEGIDELPKRWRVKLQGVAPATDADTMAAAARDEGEGEELEVDSCELTLLTLRLTEEQRERWQNLLEGCPGLFGDRIRPENEARWQKLFGGCATRFGGAVGAGAAGGSADLGLPLEQSFVATLHGIICDWLKFGQAGQVDELVVDLLGCRPALELEEPEKQLAGLFASKTLAGAVRRGLTVRMCGPEVGCDAWRSERVDINAAGDGAPRRLAIEVQPGLYHAAFPEGGADIIVAMNAGMSLPQYAMQWAPTLRHMAQQPRRALLAVTSYSPGEILREERLLRRQWASDLKLVNVEQLSLLVAELHGKPPWTLGRDLELPGIAKVLRRGDVVQPATSSAEVRRLLPRQPAALSGKQRAEFGKLVLQVAKGPWCFDVLPSEALVYVGPNPTPGRSRNYGKLLLWVGDSGTANTGVAENSNIDPNTA